MQNNTIKCYGELFSVYESKTGKILLNMRFKNAMLKTDRLTFTYYGDEPVESFKVGKMYEVEGFYVSRKKIENNEPKYVQYFAATKLTESKDVYDAVRDGEGIKNGFNGFLSGIVVKKTEQNGYTNFVVKTNEKVSNYINVAVKTNRLKEEVNVSDVVSVVYNASIKMTKTDDGKTDRRTRLYVLEMKKC